MTGLRERKKLDAWLAIRGAALQLFAERGFEGVTVEEIAATANVSRATFFTYFRSKEAVVFDHHPHERDAWLQSMSARPADEPLWDALCAVLTEFNERLSDLMPLRRRLKAASPTLSRSRNELGVQFKDDLETWVLSRADATEPTAALLQLNAALAAATTAYQSWGPDRPYAEYLETLRGCLARLGTGLHASV